MSINACDTIVSMLFSLLLANIRKLSCFFFLFLVLLSNSFIIPVKEKIKVKFAPAIQTGAPKTLTEEIIHTSPLLAERTIKIVFL